MDLHLNNVESHSTNDALCQVWLKLAQWFWRRTIFEISSLYFRYLTIISPWKRRGPLFKQTWILFTQGYFVSSLVEIGPVVLEKKMKIWKVYRQTDGRTDRQTDNGWQVIRKSHLSFKVRWAKNRTDGLTDWLKDRSKTLYPKNIINIIKSWYQFNKC